MSNSNATTPAATTETAKVRTYEFVGLRFISPNVETREAKPTRFLVLKGTKILQVKADGTKKPMSIGQVILEACSRIIDWPTDEKPNLRPHPESRTEACKVNPCDVHAIAENWHGATIDRKKGRVILPSDRRGRQADTGLNGDDVDSLFSAMREESEDSESTGTNQDEASASAS